MMLVEPSQKKVATIASPRCGFVGLNPLMKTFPLWPTPPFNWSRVMPLAVTSNRGAAGPAGSLHPARTSAAASSTARPPIVVRLLIISLTSLSRPPRSGAATAAAGVTDAAAHGGPDARPGSTKCKVRASRQQVPTALARASAKRLPRGRVNDLAPVVARKPLAEATTQREPAAGARPTPAHR